MQQEPTKSDMIRARVSPKLKNGAEAVFAALGLNATDAITLFYKQVVMHEGLPFPLKVPNKETMKALREVRARKNLVKSDLSKLRRTFK